MNLCLDCNSTYSTPGTCNCFAPGGKRAQKPETLKIGDHDVTVEPIPWAHPIMPYDQGWYRVSSHQCPNCGGSFVGSHICGYYNPALSPTWSA